MLSAYADGELDAEEAAELEELLEEEPQYREELERLQRLAQQSGEAASEGLFVEPPPEDVWDAFLDGVYNRVERQTGWAVFVVGAALLAAVGVFYFIVEPWADWWIKTVVALPVFGLVILFVSVLRQRLFVAETDRYSRDVRR